MPDPVARETDLGNLRLERGAMAEITRNRLDDLVAICRQHRAQGAQTGDPDRNGRDRVEGEAAAQDIEGLGRIAH